MTNYTKSETLNNIPRHLKTQPGAPRTHLAYITDDEAKMLQKKKPGTPHGTRSGIPSYDYETESGGWVSGGDANDFGGYSGSSSSYEPYSGNSGSDDYGIGSGGEFGGSINYGSGLPGGGSQEDSYDWTTDSDYGESTYVPWQTSPVDNFVSAYGGLTYDWVDPNSEFLTQDIWGNPLPDHGEHWYEGGGLWNPFYAGEDPQGNPIWLNEGQFNEMMSVGEFGILPPGGTTGGGGGGGGGGWGYGYGGGRGGSGGGGGSGMQVASAEGPGGMRSPWGPSDIQRRYINRMRTANRGGIISLC